MKIITGRWGDEDIWRWETLEEMTKRERMINEESANLYTILDRMSPRAIEGLDIKI